MKKSKGKRQAKETTDHNAIEDADLAIYDEEFTLILQVLLPVIFHEFLPAVISLGKSKSHNNLREQYLPN